jgi:hypothetical protein
MCLVDPGAGGTIRERKGEMKPDEHASVVVTYPDRPDRSDYVIATLHRSTPWACSDLVSWARSARRAGYRNLVLRRTPCNCPG